MTTYTTKHNAIRAAKKALGNDAIPTVDFVVLSQEAVGPRGNAIRTNWSWKPVAKEAAPVVADVVSLVAPVTDEQIAAHQAPVAEPVPEFAQEPAPVKPAKAKRKAVEAAPENQEPEGKIRAAQKAVARADAKLAKAAPAPKAERGPIGKTKLMIEACCRKGGATPADLRAISGGTANPWPYVIHNPKGTGWAQRFGYEFRNEKVNGKQTYFLTPVKGNGKKAK